VAQEPAPDRLTREPTDREAVGRPWRATILRALNPDGSVIWPDHCSLEAWQGIYESGGSAYFSSIWMQDPSGLAGDVFHPEWFQEFAPPGYQEEQPSPVRAGATVTVTAQDLLREGVIQAILPDVRGLVSLQAHDLAIKQSETADFYCRANAYVAGDRSLYVHDVRVAKLTDLQMMEDVVTAARRTKARSIGIEAVGFQSLMFNQLRRDHPRLPIVELDPANRDKVMRARPLADHFERGKVFLLYGARWNPNVRYQLMEFPGGAHDDVPDTLAYLFEMALQHTPGALDALAQLQTELRVRSGLHDAMGGSGSRLGDF
jgi:predicted phage terminase large subunit-like protein